MSESGDKAQENNPESGSAGGEVGRRRGDCLMALTESQFSYAPPKIKKSPSTRASRLEQFLWQEFYNEYLRQKGTVDDTKNYITEYFEQYCKDLSPEDAERKEQLANKYPLYCTSAITLWNHDGDVTRTFKKKYSITRPIEECTEKFAP